MKKVFALLLALALLIPMGLVSVASAEGEVTAQPFYALGWSNFDNEKYPYLDELVTANFSNIGDKARITYGGAAVMYGSYSDADVTKFAEAIKKTMDARPEGLRYLHLFGISQIMKLAPKNVINLEHSIRQLKDLTTAVLKKYKEIGGQLDGLVIDTEYIGMASYYINNNTDKNTNNVKKNPLVYKQIVEDPVYQTRIRPMLEERGFKFYENVTDYTPEIYGISGNAGSAYSNCAAIWDTVIRNHLNQYANEWCYEPLKEYFPEASMSDYQSIDSDKWLKMSAVTDDGVVISGGNSVRVGTASCYSYYYARPGASFFESLQKYASYNDALYEASAFNNLLYDINFTRHMYESTDTKQIAPWITSYVYDGKKPSSMAYTPYYSELLFHLGMFDPEPFLSYTYVNEYSPDYKADYSSEKWLLTCQIMNDVMAELSRVAGYSDRAPIAMPMNWNSKFVLSGMYANGRNIWRITPNTDVISVADFKVEGTEPTFRVNGETVTFPGGKIIETADIYTAGSCGYWVETAKDVTPIVTTDADRYEKYPSLLIDFEKYAEGSFNYNTCEPTKAWEFTWKKGATCTVQTVDGNKVLALLSAGGSVDVRSVVLPGNVTAGDSYAEDQVWEITATIPEGLAADAEILLLKYAGAKQKTDDGGFKIAGGKLYYSDNGEYKELMDIAAGTYTFKRVMDFNDAAAFACTYYVYDATGKELKATQKVAAPVFTTITNISFYAANADKAVLLDDYKISIAGTTLDFGVYDAATGMNASADAPRAASTAYRLSWLNATDKEETATVMAAIYEGNTLKEEQTVKELKLAPGCDGVETGVIEVAEGQSVKVYVKSSAKVTVLQEETDGDTASPTPGDTTDPTTAPTDDAAPTDAAPTDGTTPAGKKGGISTPMIVLIAAVAVAVVAVVVALVATTPKKKADAPAEEAKEEPEETEEPKA